MNALFSALINGILLSFPLGVATWLALHLTPRTVLNAATRYAILWAVLLLILLLPAFCLQRTTSHRPAPHVTATVSMAAGLPVPDTTPPPANLQPPVIPVAAPRGYWPNLILPVWVIATLVMLLRLAVSWTILERRKARGQPPTEELKRRAGAWLEQCQSTRKVALLIASSEISGPMATGPWRPAILFPARFFDQFSAREIDQIGLHEAAHLARYDDAALTIQRILEAVFFFHPVVHWIARQINLEREIACDDFVVRQSGAPRQYAGCLTHVAEVTAGIRPSLTAAAVTDESSNLTRRVEMLLDPLRHTGTRLLKSHLTAGLALLALLAGAAAEMPVLFSLVSPVRALAKTAAALSPVVLNVPAVTPMPPPPKRVKHELVDSAAVDGGFNAEIASAPRFTTAGITPVEWHLGGVAINSAPGSIDYKMLGIKTLFLKAWPMDLYRFVWPARLMQPNGNIIAFYDIAATMPVDTTPEQLQLMLRTLLADRFKMSAHWETRNVDIYALKVAPGGIKFRKSTIQSSGGQVMSAGPEGWHWLLRPPRQPAAPASGRTLSQFTQTSSGLLDRPLVDMTGLEGYYDIDLFVARDPGAREFSEGWRNAMFFDALETQLGLTVEAQTLPTKMLVIDNLELVPTEN